MRKIDITLNEIKDLKKKIDKNKKELEKRFLYTKLVSDTLNTLIVNEANNIMIKIYLNTMGDLVDKIKNILNEIEK